MRTGWLDSLTHRLTCPWCDTTHNALTAAPGGQPKAGEAVVCMACGNVAIFTSPTTLREARPEEIDAIEHDPRFTENLTLARSVAHARRQ